MIYNEDAYYQGYYRNVRALGAIPALVFDTICGLIREKGIGEISNSTLLEMLGIKSKNTLNDAIDKIIKAGYIEQIKGNGRSKKCTYYLTEKGSKNAPFMNKKGVRICTERGQNLTEKGSENDPINTELNKELKEKGETPTLIMNDFEIFWKAFPGSPEFDYDKEKCKKVWSLMCEEWRAKLIAMAQNGLRWRTKENDKPIFYLRDYTGQDAHVELPFVRQGSKTFARFISDHEHKDTICIMRYEGSLAYCLEDAKQQMLNAGAEFIRNF